MVISHPNRYVYIAIPKTACQAVSQWLVDNHWGEYVEPMTHRWWIPEDCAGYTIFTVVRNPYDQWWGYDNPAFAAGQQQVGHPPGG